MAANTHFSGTGSGEISTGRPIGHLLVYVTSSTITLSFDNGESTLTIPTGFYSFPVGPTQTILVGGAGTWDIVAVQT